MDLPPDELQFLSATDILKESISIPKQPSFLPSVSLALLQSPPNPPTNLTYPPIHSPLTHTQIYISILLSNSSSPIPLTKSPNSN
ncbi:hypothetical protein HanHA300_Chr14g0516661 [Helianthus annuus]|nr:hypothetical protein HanHA300_Chr14g0516661 [Helianthus annuus]